MQENKGTEVKRGQSRVTLAGAKEFLLALFGAYGNANERLVSVIASVAFGIAAYFFGSCDMLFGTFPLGIALLCAADRHLPCIFAGLALSSAATGLNTTVCVVTYAVLVFVRIAVKLALEGAKRESLANKTKKREDVGVREQGARIYEKYRELFTESVYMRMASAAFGAFCLSLYAIVVGGFRYYDLFGAFFSVICAPVATFIFSAYFDDTLKGTRLRDVAVLALLVALSYSTRDITVFGVYVGAFITFFTTLCIGRRRGILTGCISGLCLGLAFEPIYAPLFVLEAAAAGVLWNISSLAAATAGCVVGMIWGVYVNGFEALSCLLPALLCGAMVFGAADRLALITSSPELIRVATEEKSALEALLREQINRSDESSMKRLSSMFSELAQAFHNLSDRQRRPAALDLRRMCDTVFDKYCMSCPKREICWGNEYSATLDELNLITSSLHVKARADVSVCSDTLRARCESLPQIIGDVNESCAALTEHALMRDRAGVFALDYDGISRILAESLESGREDYVLDEKLAQRIGESLKKLRFSYTGIIAYGGRRKSVAVKGLDASRSKVSIKDLKAHIEKAAGHPMADPVFVPSGSRFDMTVTASRLYRASEYSFSLKATGEKESSRLCGDSCVSFENGRDYYYSLISDGMGAGKEAALTSRVCAMFLEKMLGANNRSETAIRLLNSFMSEKDATARYECSATVDLTELDLLSGRMTVIKSGAAPSFVKRGEKCFRMASKTLPLGIIDTPDMHKHDFEAQDGDIVIMMSDGVTQSVEESPWLVQMIKEDSGEDLKALACRIAQTARDNGSSDDISVTVIRIEKL